MANRTYQSLSNDNITTMNESNDFEGSDINLGSCEKKLRDYYNIPDNVQLTIIKLDFKKNDSSVNNVQYEVFNPKNRTERLDLTICDEEKVIVKNSIDSSISLNRISYMMESADNSIDLLSEDNEFFKDECFIFTSESGTDVLIQDRYIEYNYKNKICQNGCNLQKINITAGEAFCLCQPNTGFVNVSSIPNIEEIMNENNNLVNSDKNIEQDNNQKYSSFNAKILRCTKNIKVDFFKNYILILFSLLLLVYISLSIICIILKKKHLKRILERHQPIIITKVNEKTQEGDDTSKGIYQNDKGPKNKDLDLDTDIIGYTKAQEKDKRSFIGFLISSFKTRLIIFTCAKNKDMLIIKFLLLFYSISNYIVTNAFFFNEKNIHQIYLDEGEYNFKYQLKYIIFATLISAFFLFIAKFYITINKILKGPNQTNSLERNIYIFIAVSNCLLIFYWVYLGSLTSTYINSKRHLIINALLTFIFSSILDIMLSFISAILRKIALCKKKETLYNLSKIINCL